MAKNWSSSSLAVIGNRVRLPRPRPLRCTTPSPPLCLFCFRSPFSSASRQNFSPSGTHLPPAAYWFFRRNFMCRKKPLVVPGFLWWALVLFLLLVLGSASSFSLTWLCFDGSSGFRSHFFEVLLPFSRRSGGCRSSVFKGTSYVQSGLGFGPFRNPSAFLIAFRSVFEGVWQGY